MYDEIVTQYPCVTDVSEIQHSETEKIRDTPAVSKG